MRLYMWTISLPFGNGFRDYRVSYDRACARETRRCMLGNGHKLGPLVAVDLPEPGTTKGKRGKK